MLLILCTTMALESVTSCIGRCMCIGAVYLNGGCCTFAVVIIGTVVGFAVNLDFVAAAAICVAVFHGTVGSLSETATACFISTVCVVTGDLDITARTEFVVVVNTFCCRTVQNSHVCNLLIDQIK